MGFYWHQHLSPRGCLPLQWAIYMYKSITIYTRTSCQLSVYRTTGPLVSWFYTCIQPQGRGRQPPGDKILMSTEMSCHFIHLLQVSKNIFEVWFYTFFSWFNTRTATWQNQQNIRPVRSESFLCAQWVAKDPSFLHAGSEDSEQTGRTLILLGLSYRGSHVYSPGIGADSPQGIKFWCQQKGLITLPICCKFQRNLWSLILYNFIHDLIHVYSPRAGDIQPPGDKVLMSTEISSYFGHLLLVSNHRRQ